METVFYELPAYLLEPGVSTSDGQDVIEVRFDGDSVSAIVYTPRPDDPDADAYNLSTPEGRIFGRDEAVRLAVFPDTQVDLSDHPEAKAVELGNDSDGELSEMNQPDIVKTTITITLLHRSDNLMSDYDIEDVLYEMREGEAVGWETSRITEPVAPERVEQELIALGNDGTFFNTDDDSED